MLDVIIFLLFLIGVVFIVYSVIKFKPAENATPITEETLEKLQVAISDADNAMEELSELSQNIFDEITAKYKELLYLYSLVEQKQADSSNKPEAQTTPSSRPLSKPVVSVENVPQEKGFHSFMTEYNSTNPKHKEIKELAQKGMPVQEIAKSLNLGQGEVRLVLELGKAK